MTLKEEFATRNFSIYAQWLGVLSIILCFALGIANIFTFDVLIIVFSCLCIASGFIIIFVEIPLLLRICPTSASFDAAVRKITTNYMRAATYGVMALIQYLSCIRRVTSLLVPAIFMTFTAACYALAGLKGQAFVGSKTLGGAGVAQMIV
ncbi:Golgi apparatus membrane protein TVP18 [Cladorrhinum sp. PSN332]|nr:Golgi apparatus membrane protein TVP18 [Cladorrhinum sp. PSN332]